MSGQPRPAYINSSLSRLIDCISDSGVILFNETENIGDVFSAVKMENPLPPFNGQFDVECSNWRETIHKHK